MTTLLVVIHYFLCIILIISILLQAGKGADIGAVFGGGGSQTVFGGRGPATILNKITAAVAILFLVTSIGMAHVSKNREMGSVFKKQTIMEEVEQTDGGIPGLDKKEASKEKSSENK